MSVGLVGGAEEVVKEEWSFTGRYLAPLPGKARQHDGLLFTIVLY